MWWTLFCDDDEEELVKNVCKGWAVSIMTQEINFEMFLTGG